VIDLNRSIRNRHPGTMPAAGAIASLIVLWGCSGILYAQTTAPTGEVHHDQIFVSLPIALGAGATSLICVWKIAALVTKHLRRMEDHEARMDAHEKARADLVVRLDRLDMRLENIADRLDAESREAHKT